MHIAELKKMEVGIGCYFWASSYRGILRRSDALFNPDHFISELYHKQGIVPIGVFKLFVRYIIKK